MKSESIFFVTPSIFLFLFLILISPKGFLTVSNLEQAYANGIRNNFGLDFLPPLNLDDTPISLFVEFKPSMVESPAKEKRQLIFKLIDINNNYTYSPENFEIIIFKNKYDNGKVIEEIFLNDTFFSNEDSLILEFNSFDNGKKGKYNNSIINSMVKADDNGLIHVNYPILESGFYHLKVKVNIKNLSLETQEHLQFDSYLSLGQIMKVNGFIEPKKENITILSYNDIIVNKTFNIDTNEITFKIPFKYNLTRIEEGFIYIHAELKIPKSFQESFYNNSSIKINDINFEEISKSSVSIDPFSNSSNVIIHYILDSNSLFKLTKDREVKTTPEMTIKFSLVPN